MRSIHEVAVALKKSGAEVVEHKDHLTFTQGWTKGLVTKEKVIVDENEMGYEKFVSRVVFSCPNKTLPGHKTNIGDPKKSYKKGQKK